MTTLPKEVALSTLGDGAADELFRDAVGQVLRNIADVNTDPTAKRAIVLTFSFTADDERAMGDIVIKCATKLAGVKGLKVGVYYGRHEGVPVAVEAPRQNELFPKPDSRPRIVEPAAQGGGS